MLLCTVSTHSEHYYIIRIYNFILYRFFHALYVRTGCIRERERERCTTSGRLVNFGKRDKCRTTIFLLVIIRECTRRISDIGN